MAKSDVPECFLSSSIYLGEVPSGSLLLNENACYRWFIVVPRGNCREWDELPMGTQQKLLVDINRLSGFLKNSGEGVEKINVASIGNMVPQFHLHVVGRNSSDPAWPGPVWGHPETAAYAEGEIEAIVGKLVEALEGFVR